MMKWGGLLIKVDLQPSESLENSKKGSLLGEKIM